MSELINGSAIVVPEQKKLEDFALLPVAEQQAIAGQVAEMGAIAADEALKSDMGFDILGKLYENCAGLILNTSPWVIPVKHELPEIKKHLNDPAAFERGFNTLCVDISNYNENLQGLYAFHKGKTGAPAASEVTDVLDLADGYNKLATHYEDGIQPLMMALAKTVEEEYVSILEKQVDATA
jgi:hypothetical protein